MESITSGGREVLGESQAETVRPLGGDAVMVG
jgi:hypothetical protein